MGREILSEMRRIKKRDLICYLDFICAHDSTGIAGLQASMIRVLAARMPFEDKQTLIAKHFMYVNEIQGSVRETDEELIREYFSAVTATIAQAKEAKKAELGKRPNNCHQSKKQTRARFFTFSEPPLDWIKQALTRE